MSIGNVVQISHARRRRLIDRPITITKFPNEKAFRKREKKVSPRKLATEWIANRRAASKDKLPWLKLAAFGDQRSKKNCLRTNANVLWISGIEVEHDAGTMSLEEARRRLRESGIASILYTTPSHTPEAPRWRVLCPLSHPYPPEAREQLVAWLNGLLDGALAPESFTLSQSYYYGQVEGASPIAVEIIDGKRALNDAAELATTALGKEKKSFEDRKRTSDEYELGPGVDWEWIDSLLAAIPLTHRDAYKVWLDVGMALHYLGEQDGDLDAAYERWCEWSNEASNTDDNDKLLPEKWEGFYDDPKRNLATAGKIYYYATTLGNWKPKRHPEPEFDPEDLTVSAWLERDIPLPDHLLGELLSTTTRAMLIAPTGLGKTNFAMAKGFAIALGIDFLHWQGSGKPRRVLFVDGEMPAELIKERLGDAIRRAETPVDLFVISPEMDEFSDMPPLNEEVGQQYIDKIIEKLGGVDFVIFDNMQALIAGTLKDDESWGSMLPWVKSLTNRKIGQLWIHHTGREETHGYGDSRREWQMDLVMLMERAAQTDADIAFKLSFSKARRRKPSNQGDFDGVFITLENDVWECKGKTVQKSKSGLSGVAKHAFDIWQQMHDGEYEDGVTNEIWRKACINSNKMSGSDKPKAHEKAFERARLKLIQEDRIVIEGDLVLPPHIEI
jgi:hypothetical protein